MTHIEPDRRELRIAPVMTGGTSLSVWMGGATVELYSMLREGEDDASATDGSIYRRLCALTKTQPVIDVITGTSAGGLNGALLTAGVAYGVDQGTFAELRSTWMDVADITALLRDPASESRPISLLNGKEKFLKPVQDLIENWAAAAPSDRLDDPHSVDLVATYTSIEPRDLTSVDDFGEEMSEIRYAGTLHFTTDDFRNRVGGDSAAVKLAHAAKASASLPGVFESSALSWWKDELGSGTPPNLYPNLTDRTDLGSQFVVDGGVVVNMPLTEALERIYSRPADTQVRRVVVYVAPTPKVAMRTQASNRHANCVDQPASAPHGNRGASQPGNDDRPPLTKTLSTIFTAPRAEGISTDLRDIERHNWQVSQQRSTRATLGWLLSDGNDPLIPNQPTVAEAELMTLYRAARAEDSVEALFERLRPVLTDRSQLDQKLVRASLIEARRAQLPQALPAGRLAESEWHWGVSPVEESVSTIISIFNRVLGLPFAAGPDQSPAAGLAEARAQLQEHRWALHSALQECYEIRAWDDEYWAVRLSSLARQQVVSEADVTEFARAGFSHWPELSAEERGTGPAVTRAEVLDRLRAAFLAVAGVVLKTQPFLSMILTAAGADENAKTARGLREENRKEATGLARELAAIRCRGDLHEICWGLLRLHVMQTVMLGRVQRREQRVEILQISWNTPDYLTGRAPQEKLVGTEVARLGAFLKPSWRANDYFWGRMDAAPRLLQLLTDPRRLAQLGVTCNELCAKLDLVADELLSSELAFLDSADQPIPHRLPRLVEILARRRQLEIAREELPHIASTIGKPHTPAKLRVAVPEQARRFRETAKGLSGRSSDREIEGALCAMRVGEESLDTELGSPLLNHVITQASAVAIDAARAPSSGLKLPGAVKPLVQLGRRQLVGFVGRKVVKRFSRGGTPATYRCRATETPPV